MSRRAELTSVPNGRLFHLIDAMARQGLAAMFSSSELDEVDSLADG